MSLAILISTCERYRELAQWTSARLDRLWDNHPPVFFSGLSGGAECLEMRSDERDWMGVTLDAAKDLQARGVSAVYLILEDHPPLGRCNATHLNRELPDVLARLGAANIGLLGHGQHRPPVGRVLNADGVFLEEVPADDRWRFSLHPALWDLGFLIRILQLRMSQYEPGRRTPWAFERHRDGSDVFPGAKGGGSYRICGAKFGTGFRRRQQTFAALRFLFDVALCGVRLTRGWDLRQKCAAEWMWAYAFYNGPYPLFWSGLMVQGRRSPHLERYLRWFPDPALAEGMEKI